MADLNSASIDDIVASGVDWKIARIIRFWAPYRRWEDLLSISEIDDTVLGHLQSKGFEVARPADVGWAMPRPFKLSVGQSA